VCVCVCVYNTFYQETTTITAVITFGGFQFLLSLLSAPSEPATRLDVVVQRSTNYLSSPKTATSKKSSSRKRKKERESVRERSKLLFIILWLGSYKTKRQLTARLSVPWCNHLC